MNNSRISMGQYQNGVLRLLKMTERYGTSGSRAAALVLLSTYNASEWPLDITELCIFDRENYVAALAVIRGRVELGTEPHQLIKGGDKIFNDLWDRYIRFHISNAYKSTCSECYGSGRRDIYDEDGEPTGETEICRKCNGEGLIT